MAHKLVITFLFFILTRRCQVKHSRRLGFETDLSLRVESRLPSTVDLRRLLATRWLSRLGNCVAIRATGAFGWTGAPAVTGAAQ